MPLTDKLQQNFAHPTVQPSDGQQKADPTHVLEAIAAYNKYGKVLRRNQSLQDVALKLAEIAQLAEESVLSEADDWFDAHTLKRNMKEIKSYSADFQKLAKEADMMEQRMVALYDDMGRVLERYFELPEDMEPDPIGEIGNGMAHSKTAPAPKLPSHDPLTEADESSLHTEPMDGPTLPAGPDTGSKTDELTLRAIQAVYKNLQSTNPEYASRFAKLSPEKMQQVVWKLVK